MPPRSYKNEIGTIIHKIFELVNCGALSPNKADIKHFWKTAVSNAEEKIRELYPSLTNLSIADYNAMFTTIRVATAMAPKNVGSPSIGRIIEHPNEHYVILPGLLKGVIDRIDSVSDGTYRIVDYKTGGVYDEEGAIKKDYVDQLNLYAYMLEESENVRVSSLAIIDKEGSVIDVPYYPANKHEALSLVGALLKRINTAIGDGHLESLLTPGEKNCFFCPVYHLCPQRHIFSETAFKNLEGIVTRIWNDDQLELKLSDNTLVTMAKFRTLEFEEWATLVGKRVIFVNIVEIIPGQLYNRTDNTVVYVKD